MTTCRLVVLVVALAALTPAHAAIIFEGAPGTAAPPSTLGPYTMTPFPLDPRPRTTVSCGIFVCTVNQAPLVSDVPSPLGDSVSFSAPVDHLRVGPLPEAWGGWTHGYGGDVYFDDGSSLVLTLPVVGSTPTGAFYFYVEPNALGQFSVFATAQNGTSSGQVVISGVGASNNPGDARYLGFYATDGDRIKKITIQVFGEAEGFAIGEFGISMVPEPTSLILITVGGLVVMLRRRCRS